MLSRNRLSPFTFHAAADRVLPRFKDLSYDVYLEVMGGIAPQTGGHWERSHMEVHGPHAVHGPSNIRPVETTAVERVDIDRTALEIPSDEVSISPAARMLEQIVNDPGLRAEKIERIRTAIASGVYETPDKLRIALDRLLASLE
jgi:anti-sigma28 factor (negative regulator of flagellin synthesis)